MFNGRISMKQRLFKKYLLSVACLMFLIVGSFVIFFQLDVTNVSADNVVIREKQVISRKIEKGDTLWSIAKEYITEEYNDINDYIKEIKLSNGLTSDLIHEGKYIIVPYYSSDFSNSYAFVKN